jgi:hypothetical protein
MQSPAISDDRKPTGKYWIKLASAARNILYEEKQQLKMCFWIKILKPSLILRTTLLLYQFRIGYRTFVMLLLKGLKQGLKCASMFQT